MGRQAVGAGELLQTKLPELCRQYQIEEKAAKLSFEVNTVSGKGIEIEKKNDTIHLTVGERKHVLRALHRALQQIATEGDTDFHIQETPEFEHIGIMIDCSRNGTISPAILKTIVEEMAAIGADRLYLYMEDVYEVEGEPYFGAYRGRYTYEELHELDCFAAGLCVEVIPCIQTLAHLHTFLKWPAARKFRDTEDILLIGDPDTKELIRKMILHACRPFSTNKIHIGMDEADRVGLGQYLLKHGYREKKELMEEQLLYVKEVCLELGKEPVMWSDMFFRTASPTGDYYDVAPDCRLDVSDRLLANVELVYWDYYHHDQETYDKNFHLHRQISDRIVFAGGGWTWNGLAPHYKKASETLRTGLACAKSNGVSEAICTFWFDNGMETPAGAYLFSAVEFIQTCYGENDREKNNIWLTLFSGHSFEEWMCLTEFDVTKYESNNPAGTDNPSKWLFYQDPLVGIFDGQIDGKDLRGHYRELKNRLATVKAEGGRYDSLFCYYRLLAEILEEKWDLGLRLRLAYAKRDADCLRRLSESMEELASKVEKLLELRRSLWYRECKAFGVENLDIRFGGVATRLKSAAGRVRQFCDKEVPRLEELEEKTVLFHEDESGLGSCPFWENIVSAANISGI